MILRQDEWVVLLSLTCFFHQQEELLGRGDVFRGIFLNKTDLPHIKSSVTLLQMQ